MPHPADLEGLRAFADGLDEILVGRGEAAHHRDAGQGRALRAADRRRPRVIGRRDENGAPLLSELGELSVDAITRALARSIGRFHESGRMRERLAFLDAKEAERRSRAALSITRLPYFCSGCPHNRSTRVPAGSRAHGGVGCHYMATYMERDNLTHTQMGGEGRDLDRTGALRRHAARVPESRRRHLLPLLSAGNPGLHRGRRQHHLQDPLQRRGGDDRRAARRRAARPHADLATGARGGRAPDRGGERGAGRSTGTPKAVSRRERASSIATRSTGCSGSCASVRG